MSDFRRGGPEPPRGGGPRPGSGGNPAPPFPAPKPQEVDAVVRGGDAAVLVETARAMGTWLGQPERPGLPPRLSSSQLRSVFGTVRRIEMRWPRSAADEVAQRELNELRLLKPRLAYQVGRAKQGVGREGRGILSLEPVLSDAIDRVSNRAEFQHFVDYLEAILAYHKSAGGR